MADGTIPTAAHENCWTQIGMWGDRTCPELRRFGHCRNCDVYGASGRRLMDRPAPPDYLEWWTSVLAQERPAAAALTSSHLVFRVGQAWFALRAAAMREITDPTAIRTIPHRSRELLRGLVNVRGELYPCVSLHALLGEESKASRKPRFLVARGTGGDWVFPVDEVEGMQDVAIEEIQPLPVTLRKTDAVYTIGLFASGQKKVAIIDEGLIFDTLARRIA